MQAMREYRVRAAATMTLVLVAGTAANAQVATALIREGDVLAGNPVTSINNPASNHIGGYAIAVNAGTVSHVWGNATGGPGAILVTEATYGSVVQTAIESFFGFSDAGEVAYSASGNGGPVGGFDSVWVDTTNIAIQGAPAPSLPGQFWTFGSRPGITADGIPYWAGGTTGNAGGTTNNRGLFFGVSGTPLLLGGQIVPGLPFALNPAVSSVGFDYRVSRLGGQYIAPVLMSSGSSANDEAVVLSGSGLIIDGTLTREGNPVPVAAGGQGGEAYSTFGSFGITESGTWMFTSNTTGPTTSDEIVMVNGQIVLREGNLLPAGGLIGGAIDMGAMNDNGDFALVWDIDTKESLLFNDTRVISVGEQVDFDGDGLTEPNSILSDFNGIASLSISNRLSGNVVDIYFTGLVDFKGTPSTSDDVDAAFRVRVTLPPPACQADVNGDGAVNGADLSVMLGEFGCTSGCQADINGDDAVNGADLSVLLGEFGCGT